LRKLAPQELIDQARDLRFVAEELIELGPFEDERPAITVAVAGFSVRNATSPTKLPRSKCDTSRPAIVTPTRPAQMK
jgi:hypothetical protein